jgi:hypothetical protein
MCARIRIPADLHNIEQLLMFAQVAQVTHTNPMQVLKDLKHVWHALQIQLLIMIGEGEMFKELIVSYQLYGSVIAKKDMHVRDALLQQSHAAFVEQTRLKRAWDPLVLSHSANLVHQEALHLLATGSCICPNNGIWGN